MVTPKSQQIESCYSQCIVIAALLLVLFVVAWTELAYHGRAAVHTFAELSAAVRDPKVEHIRIMKPHIHVTSTMHIVGKTLLVTNGCKAKLCILDGNNHGNHIFHVNASGELHLDSLQLQNASWSGRGGALHIEDASAFLSNIVFVGNCAGHGGAVSIVNSTVSFSTCKFSHNTANESAGAVFILGSRSRVRFHRTDFMRNVAPTGGGVTVTDMAVVSFNRVSFKRNRATSRGGAGLLVHSLAHVSCSRCRFGRNFVQTNLTTGGTSVSVMCGAAVFANEPGNLFFRNSTFLENACCHTPGMSDAQLWWGGAVFIRQSVGLHKTWNHTFAKCIFKGNVAANAGAVFVQSNAYRYESGDAALPLADAARLHANFKAAQPHANFKLTGSHVRFSHCAFQGNRATRRAGALQGDNYLLENCNFTGNADSEGRPHIDCFSKSDLIPWKADHHDVTMECPRWDQTSHIVV